MDMLVRLYHEHRLWFLAGVAVLLVSSVVLYVVQGGEEQVPLPAYELEWEVEALAEQAGSGTEEAETGEQAQGAADQAEKEQADAAQQVVSEPVMIVVDIKGEVHHPSVYTLPEGSRVYQAIEQAGGLLDAADVTQVNLAAELTDGTVVFIPDEEWVRSEQAHMQGAAAAGMLTSGLQPGVNTGEGGSAFSAGGQGDKGSMPLKVNLNTADAEQLQQVNGIGPAIARTIVEYRREHGHFQTVDDLQQVSGIGVKTLAKLRSSLTIE